MMVKIVRHVRNEESPSDKAVGTSDRAGEHIDTSDIVPVCIDGLHIREDRVVGKDGEIFASI